MDKKSRKPLAAPIPRKRFFLLIAIFFVWLALIVTRLVWLQVLQHASYAERALHQQQRTFTVAPRRGVLYDRNLQQLAMTVQASSIYAIPSQIEDKLDAAQQLSEALTGTTADADVSPAAIEERLDAAKSFVWIARKVDAAAAERVSNLNLKGVYMQPEFKRYYPDGRLAAQVLGYVSLDDNGLGGIEHRYDAQLHGVPGRMVAAVDARQQSFSSVESDPQPGENLVLTLDEHIQFIAEKALDAAMQKTQSVGGTIVVQDPNTSQILALAVRPSFDPNDIRHVRPSMLHDSAVSNIYEPGSVFKLVTYSAAINEHLTNPNEVIDGQNGKIVVAGRLIHDWHPFGNITVTKALDDSSDVCAIKVGLRLGPQKFYDYIRAYGFGQRSGMELPAETRGLLRPPNRWQASSIGSLAMGQEVGVTPIQAITMISAIANGGVYLPPRIVLQATPTNKGEAKLLPAAFHPEDTVPDPLPAGAHRVITTLTAAEMRRMMETVVQVGTGQFVKLNGYSAGGKSGTAQKVDPGSHTYSKTDYIASFGGFAPVNQPAISVLVVLDSPRGGHHGGQVAGPVFGQVVQQTLEYLGVPHDLPLLPAKMVAKSRAPELDGAMGDHDHPGDLNALFAQVNDLPADDPLRNPVQPSADTSAATTPSAIADKEATPHASLESLVAESTTQSRNPVAATPPLTNVPTPQEQTAQPMNPVATHGAAKVTVPNFSGQSMRQAVQTATQLGLGVQVLGSGVDRAQAPAAGTQVAPGTEIVLRFAR
jgi:cell division protein FtsI (penicillin-binding protein 3)